MPAPLKNALSAACKGNALSRQRALELIPLLPHHFSGIVSMAGMSAAVARPCVPFACGIVNAKSGRCSEDCAFCAQSIRHKTEAPVHALLSEEELYVRACRFKEQGVDRMGIVASGAGPSERDFEALCRAAERISAKAGIRLCASLGLLQEGQAAMLREAGFSRYHHNLECSRSFYPAVCSSHPYDLRIRTVRMAKEAGLSVCAGGLFGMGESWEQRLELSETLAELDADAIPVNFLIPIPGTRLEKRAVLEANEALSIIALLRLMHPARDIVVCGGRGKVLGEWDATLFWAGANGLMVGDYLTSRGGPIQRDMAMLRALGMRP